MSDFNDLPDLPFDGDSKPLKPLSVDDIPEDIARQLRDKNLDINSPNVRVFNIPPGKTIEDCEEEIKEFLKKELELSGEVVDDIKISRSSKMEFPRSNLDDIKDKLPRESQLAIEVMDTLQPKIRKIYEEELTSIAKSSEIMLSSGKTPEQMKDLVRTCAVMAIGSFFNIAHKVLPSNEVIAALGKDNDCSPILLMGSLSYLIQEEVRMCVAEKLIEAMEKMIGSKL